MSKPLIDRWIEALESGEYPQCKGGLHKDNGYCCLGVLVELEYGPDVWRAHVEALGQICYGYGDDDYGDVLTDYPDNALTDKIEIDSHYRLELSILAIMNDEGKSFAEIASYIREKIAEHQSTT